MRMTEVVKQQLLGHAVGVPTGPNVASKAVAGLAAAALIAMSHNHIAAASHGILNRMFHVHTNTDAADVPRSYAASP
jgi:glycerol-3-phosphate dehydrogenase (NAD(P)+)